MNPKKIKNKSLTIACLVAMIFIGSCKKYEDGPLLSLHTKKHRVMGTWDVEYFSINGFDSTIYLKSRPFYGMYSLGKGDIWGNPGPALYSSDAGYHYLNGHWKFQDDKQTLHVTFSKETTDTSQLGPYRADDIVWNIQRLTEKELWLKNNYTDGREYFVKFKLFKNF